MNVKWCVPLLIGMLAMNISLADQLTVQRLESSPSLKGPAARGVQISPDGSRVTYLQGRADDQYQLDLWEYNIADGTQQLLVDSSALLSEPEVLDEVERARRERQRIFYHGIIEYDYSPDGQSLLFPLGGDLYFLPLGQQSRRLTDSSATETDARVSPGGSFVSFVREQNLYVVNLATGVERALTTKGAGVVSFATAEFVAQEEMYRFSGYWWSADERYVALTRVDESPVTLVNRYEIGADGVTTIEQRYPFAGEANANVSLWLLDVTTGERRKVPLPQLPAGYLVRVDWSPDGTLYVQLQNREQQSLDLVAIDPQTLTQRTLLQERSDSWINLHTDLTFFADGSQFLWTSERDGFRHIYHYDRLGELLSQVTRGNWAVAESDRMGGAIKALHEPTGQVYFQGHVDGPMEQHLYSVSLSGDEAPKRLTPAGGWHDTMVALDGTVFIDNGQSPEQPPYSSIRDREGNFLAWVMQNALDNQHPYAPYKESHLPTEFGTLTAGDGKTPLHYALIRPADFDPQISYPAVIYVYGGPGGASVKQVWDVGFRQLLAREGFVVLTVDNRGTGGRGTAFDDPIYRAMGSVEVDDQAAAARWLGAQPWVDEQRIGIFGWSYGGYMTLLSLFKKPELFAAGIAGAPVVDWRLYDTHYTERYMGQPDNGDAYTQSNPISYVDGLEDPLLLIHGMADDNVFFNNSVQLMAALQKAGKPFELMTYPGKRHRITGEQERIHLFTLHLDFFRRHLQQPQGDAHD